MNENEDCRESLISLKACGICNRCLKNIDEIKKVIKFYETKLNDEKMKKAFAHIRKNGGINALDD